MNEEHLSHIRHSAAHLLASAILKLYPQTLHTIGPAIENGFYYDFEFKTPLTEAEFPKIEKKMKELLPSWTDFSHRTITEEEAKELYKNNPYKLELIDEIVKKGEDITLYKCGDFEDLCRGGHSENPSKEIGAFKLMSLAGAYWRGSEENTMLTRIYGTAFSSQNELDEYLTSLEEAKKRDHKKLGAELDLFFFHETSPGMPYWLPKGVVLYEKLLEFSRSVHKQYNYQELSTPIINKKELYETSGHWFHYRDDMFISPMSYINNESEEVLEGTEVFGIKPMNCPNTMNVFKYKTRSYRDLPLRLFEVTALHRYELSGTLNGLFRAREFHQDDAHIYLRNDQVEEEFSKVLEMIDLFFSTFDLPYKLRFGTRPGGFMGEAKDWDEAEQALETVLEKSGKDYVKVEGEGAFYGPKVDILMKDSLGREWQTGTIQLDYQQPKNFSLNYINPEGIETTPVVLHRAIYGSFERFLAILIEHYAGKLPLWLMPVQVKIVPVSDKFADFASKAVEELLKEGIRVEFDTTNNTLGAKIREATLQKVPYMCIIGGQEVEKSTDTSVFVSVRTRTAEDLGQIALSELIQRIKQEIETKQ